MSSIADVDIFEIRKISCPCRESNCESSRLSLQISWNSKILTENYMTFQVMLDMLFPYFAKIKWVKI